MVMIGKLRKFENTWLVDYVTKSENPNAVYTLATVPLPPEQNIDDTLQGKEVKFEIHDGHAYLKHEPYELSKETLDELFSLHDSEDFIDEDSEDWERASLEDFIDEKDEELLIELEEWDHTCGDGCCYTYGTNIYINGEQIEDKDGTSSHQLLKAVLNKLGYTNVQVEYK
jgi:hypothetical protein